MRKERLNVFSDLQKMMKATLGALIGANMMTFYMTNRKV